VAALLTASDLRVDVEGVPAIDGLSVTTTGEHVVVLGAGRALFDAAAGLRGTSRGELRIDGAAPRAAVRERIAACAPLDPPLPPRWTLLQYVTWSARLAGHARGEAGRLAADALDRMQLASSASSRLRSAGPSMRRATVLAAAIATGAGAVLADDLLAGLPEDVARSLARVAARALADRKAVLFAARLPLESPLALFADEAIVVDGSQVTAQGPPAELAAAERTMALRVEGDVGAFSRAVEAAGGRVFAASGGPVPVHVRVELGPLAARQLLQIATEANAVVVELRPIGRAFA
jgi:ABC-type multidrug transport system ATPase subunit